MNSVLKVLVFIMKLVIIILYSIFSGTCTIFILFHMAMITVASVFLEKDFDFQIAFFTFFSIFLIISLWSLIFIKIKPLLKIAFSLILLIFLVNYIKISELIPSVNKVMDIQMCAEMNICPEGMIMKNHEGILFEINEENCIKYGYKWNDERKNCNMIK